jgi:hypothetical protein
MKKIKLLVGFLLALLILSAVSAPTVSAQALDGVWLKCKVNVKGYHVEPVTGNYFKENGSLPAYLHFVWDQVPNSGHYAVAVWTLIDGVWQNKSAATADTNVPGENFISNFFLNFVYSGAGGSLNTYHTPFITYQYKGGMLTKVTYKGTGEVPKSFSDASLNYYGNFSISGTSVDVSKLPF